MATTASRSLIIQVALFFHWGSKGSGDGQFGDPTGKAIDSQGNVHIADYTYNRIQKFDSEGLFLMQWGSPGRGDGQFNLPWGIALDGKGNIFVSEYANARVQKFSFNTGS
jgi:DNA-binding beta-propeller fold protein YncE